MGFTFKGVREIFIEVIAGNFFKEIAAVDSSLIGHVFKN